MAEAVLQRPTTRDASLGGKDVPLEYIGLGLLAVVLLGGTFLLIRLMGRSGRNEGSTHGGGPEGLSAGAMFGDHP